MFIECTFCKAKAKVPESVEGAKVKCGQCGKVYVAREPGAKGKGGKTNPAPFVIIGAALLGILAVFLIVNSSGKKPEPPPVVEAPKVEAPKIDRTGYNSAFVKLVRDLYDAAAGFNSQKLSSSIHVQRLVEQRRSTPDGAALPAFSEMTPLQKDDLLKATVETFLKGEGDAAIALWRPYDGKVVTEGDTEAVVRIEVAGRSGELQAENRSIDWKLALDKDGKWKAYDWVRYISPDEKKALSSASKKGITRVELEGGGFIRQADPRPLPHLDDTPPEVRTKIDAAVEKLLDVNLRAKDVTKVKNELEGYGKAALPILLTKMYEIQITDDHTLAQVTIVHSMLKDITGHDPGFSPLGVSPESEKKRDMAIRNWFAWYLMKGERFEDRKEGVDALEGLIQPTARDQREIDKAKQSGKP